MACLLEKEGESKADLDSVLVELGSWGKYQVRSLFFILLPIFYNSMHGSQYVFSAGKCNYRCLVPECESEPVTFLTGAWGTWALPEGAGSCGRLQPLDFGCSSSSFSNNSIPCDAWIYETNDTIVAEFNLACREWQRTLVGSMNNAALLIAMPLTAFICDRFGRRTAYILTVSMAGVVGVLQSFSNSYIMYIIFEFLTSCMGAGVYNTGFILAVEMVSLEHRVLAGNIVSFVFALGQVTLAATAWVIPFWRNLLRIIYAPSILFLFYYFIIDESLRWLISKGRKEEVAQILLNAAAINKKTLSSQATVYLKGRLTEEGKDFKPLPENTQCTSTYEELKGQYLILKVLKSKTMMTWLIICCFWFITVTFVYNGLSINSVSLAGNSYVNYILTSLVEIPGYVLSTLTLDRFGRKRSIMVPFLICGLSLLGLPFIPESMQWLQATLNMVGKLCISMVFSSTYIYTSELFPTNLRHWLLGACAMVGRIGSITAPQTPLLMAYMESLPYLLFGSMSACAGVLALLTPETVGTQLPDTLGEAESIDRRRPSTLRTPT